MKKKNRTLIILGVVLVLCVGAYIGVNAYTSAQAQKSANAAKASQIWPGSWGTVVKLSYTAGDKTFSFIQDSGKWTVADNKDFPLDQSTVSGIASALGSLSAVRTLDIPASLALYGLDKPQYTLTGSDDKGNALTLLIGAENGDNYYAMAKDGGKVYTISGALVTDLKPDYLSMITLDTVPSTGSTSINTITVTAGKTSLKLDRHQNKDNSYTWFIVSGDQVTSADDYKLAVSSDKSPGKFISDAVTGLTDIKFSSCAAFKPTADDLKKFGLDTPQMTVSVDYADTTGAGTLDQKTTKGTVALDIGAALSDGTGYYARIPGSNEINILPATVVTPLSDALKSMGTTAK